MLQAWLCFRTGVCVSFNLNYMHIHSTRFCAFPRHDLCPDVVYLNDVINAARHCCHALSSGMAHFSLKCSNTNCACLPTCLVKIFTSAVTISISLCEAYAHTCWIHTQLQIALHGYAYSTLRTHYIHEQLLDKVVDALPEGVMLRVGMTNPPHILEHVEAVARVLNHGRNFSVCIVYKGPMLVKHNELVMVYIWSNAHMPSNMHTCTPHLVHELCSSSLHVLSCTLCIISVLSYPFFLQCLDPVCIHQDMILVLPSWSCFFAEKVFKFLHIPVQCGSDKV